MEPAPGWLAVSVSVSPVLVPPGAPVDVTVSAWSLAGHEVAVQVEGPSGWSTAARVVLDERGRAVVRVARTVAGAYRVRAVAKLGAGAGAASESATFAVTTSGPGDPTAYRYMRVSRGVPARWNPCAVVTYRVNGPDAASLADLREALRRVSYETGVRFREIGWTRQVPGSRGFAYDADLVVAWVQASRTTLLGKQRAAAGGFAAPVEGRGGRPRIRNGFVVLDAKVVAGLPNGYGDGITEGQVLLHELGHVLGLDHVDAGDQLMRPTLNTVDATLYGSGDLAGLRRIGRRAGCV